MKKKGGETKIFLKRGGAVTPLRTMIHLIRTKLVVVFCTSSLNVFLGI